MTHLVGKGNFIHGEFVKQSGDEIASLNPARNFEKVFSTQYAVEAVFKAVESAHSAFALWFGLEQEQRNQHLMKLKESFIKREADMARAISLEMGKPYSESEAEAKNLSARIELMIKHGLARVATEKPAGLKGEARYHAQGPAAVIGPYNFPSHLVNAHVIPALLTGNTVVVKPSEVCPMSGEIYAECVHEAKLPVGVFNMVQGRGDVGKALIAHPLIRAVLFTGSYATGRAIKELLLDQPHKILALEMGGKNIAVVLDDADLNQALAEIVQGAFLTTGQRCTATSRLFLHRKIADRMIDSLARVTRSLKPGDPFDPKTPFGPLATKHSLERYLKLLQSAQDAGAEVLVKGELQDGGAFVTPSLHLLKKAVDKKSPYLQEELFGPDVCIEIIDNLDDAIARTNDSPYGLSNALFSASHSAFDQYYRETFSGVLNFNRSTNGALGQLPFGGVGKSGNQRAAGIDAVRYTTFPVAINYLHFGETEPPSTLRSPLKAEHEALDLSLQQLATRHELEAFLMLRGFQIRDARGPSLYLSKPKLAELNYLSRRLDGPKLIEALEPYAKIEDDTLCISLPNDAELGSFDKVTKQFFTAVAQENATELSKLPTARVHIPPASTLPESDAMLQRLYRDNFVPREKKTPVIDLQRSKGPYLSSIDEDPLVIFDAASQIASLGVGFQAGLFLNALDNGKLTSATISNLQKSNAVSAYSDFLLKHAWSGLKFVTFTSSGAEANEKAMDLCRLNGQKGRRVIAFEGSFHGRTLMALQATFNPQKRGLFEFAGYEATFIPFPSWNDPRAEPEFSDHWVKQWYDLKVPKLPDGDDLLAREIISLTRLKEELEKGDVACVIVEPMQCEGGDNYATSRFFNALRALTRGLKVPLIFDEVQTGFGLLGSFYAHSAFNLKDIHGNPDGPDCVSLAKKAQLGVVLSSWEDKRPGPIHLIQVERGLLQAQAMDNFPITPLTNQVIAKLDKLQARFPEMVTNPRAKGYAFAFDLPSAHLATELINQRFYRGYMVYVAGERTMRFRLNIKTTRAELDQLFSGIQRSFEDVKQHVERYKNLPFEAAAKTYSSPTWVAPVAPKSALPETDKTPTFSITKLTLESFKTYETEIAKLEEQAYEPGRRDTMEYLEGFVAIDGGLALLMLDAEKHVIGYAIGGPLEHSHADGPKQDPMRGKNNTFYSTNVLIAPHMRKQNLGVALKKAQIEHVRSMKTSDGRHRYSFMCGRNRVGFTTEMGAINRIFGAYTVAVYEKQYGDNEGRALYYRIPLDRPTLALERPKKEEVLDWSCSIQAPLGPHPEALFEDLERGYFTSAIATKLTLSNWVTPDFVRYAELLRKLAPKACKHAYFTSGRDEIIDKAVRCLRVSRPKGQLMIGLRGQYLGTTTAVARSLTEPESFAQPFGWFDWPLVAHPAQAGTAVSVEAISQLIQTHGNEKILGIVVELIGEKTADTLPGDFLSELEQIRSTTGVPLVFVETASALGRNGQTLFYSDAQVTAPNLVVWYTGGQLGQLFVDDTYYVAKPLTLISTWDGDEISMRRNYRHLLSAAKALGSGLAKTFEKIIEGSALQSRMSGQGLWRGIRCESPQKALSLVQSAKESGLVLEAGFHNTVIVTPHLASTPDELQRGIQILGQLL